jgi:hypothetical protein
MSIQSVFNMGTPIGNEQPETVISGQSQWNYYGPDKVEKAQKLRESFQKPTVYTEPINIHVGPGSTSFPGTQMGRIYQAPVIMTVGGSAPSAPRRVSSNIEPNFTLRNDTLETRVMPENGPALMSGLHPRPRRETLETQVVPENGPALMMGFQALRPRRCASSTTGATEPRNDTLETRIFADESDDSDDEPPVPRENGSPSRATMSGHTGPMVKPPDGTIESVRESMRAMGGARLMPMILHTSQVPPPSPSTHGKPPDADPATFFARGRDPKPTIQIATNPSGGTTTTISGGTYGFVGCNFYGTQPPPGSTHSQYYPNGSC